MQSAVIVHQSTHPNTQEEILWESVRKFIDKYIYSSFTELEIILVWYVHPVNCGSKHTIISITFKEEIYCGNGQRVQIHQNDIDLDHLLQTSYQKEILW